MKVLISVDMEGIAGVVLDSQVSPKGPEYGRFRSLATAEVNAAIDGALAAGAKQIIVSEGHGLLTNLLIEELNPVAELVAGMPRPLGSLEGIDSDTDAVFLIGFHAASGTCFASLEHTVSSGSIYDVKLNGQSVGEIGLSAALAGWFGVPVVLVTGDQAAVDETRALLDEVETVTTKQGLSRNAARCLHPIRVQGQIRQAAERAMGLHPSPFIVSPPYTLCVTFLRAIHADFAGMVPGSHRVDGRTVEWSGDDLPTINQALETMMSIAWLANVVK
jgi:D-amino peptidase